MAAEILPFTLASAADSGAIPRPWLILGKGPSFDAYRPELAEDYQVLALNHAMRGIQANVGHAIDIEVLSQLDEGDLAGVARLCLPWIPHVRLHKPLYPGKAFFGPGERTLLDCAREVPLLARYLDQGRLLAYNLGTAPAHRRHPGLPTVEGRTFSAAVALRLLAQSGAREIRTLGVDGDSDYSRQFADLAGTTRLQTAQTSFNSQFQEVADTIREFGPLSGPLDDALPVRVFVGCMPEQDLAYRVLEYSIRRHASLSVKVERLHDAISEQAVAVPVPADPANRGRTPFSFQRFAIPELCGRQGRAIYLDSDMLVVDDIRRLWRFPMNGQQMLSAAPAPGSGRPPQFSVMLLDCQALDWTVAALVAKLDAGELSYRQLMHEMVTVPAWRAGLPASWNSLEHHEAGRTQLVHFTDMDGQPWLDPMHPLAALWSGYLLQAVADGAIPRERVAEEVARGHVRPSLLVQLQQGEANPLRLPFWVLSRDLTGFMPPHRRDSRRLTRLNYGRHRVELLLRDLLRRLVTPVGRRLRNGLMLARALRRR